MEKLYVVAENTCRICLLKESNIKISAILVNKEGVKINIQDVFEKCTGLKVNENDGFPSSICEDCLLNLIKTNDFILKCEQSDNALRSSFILNEETDANSISAILESNFSVKKESETSIQKDHLIENTTNIAYTCDICAKSFTRKDRLVQHINHVHNFVKHTILKCEQSDNASRNSFTLTGETDTGSNSAITETEVDITSKHLAKDRTDKIYTCDICIKTFRGKGTLAKHVDSLHKLVKYLCDKCSLTFTQKSNLSRHIRRVHKLCHLCSKGTKNENQIDNYMNLSSATSTYLCSVCGELFPHYFNYKTHMTLHFGKEKSINANELKCPICDMVITCPRHHMKLHRNDRNYPCFTCGAIFKKLVTLRYHRLIHTGEKPHTCEICKKSFRHYSSYIIHKKGHTGQKGYMCEICGNVFRQKPHLTNHLTVHNGLKPHECRYCKKAFACKSNTTIHERIHTGYKPHSCTLCKKEFYTTTGLKKHKCNSSGK